MQHSGRVAQLPFFAGLAVDEAAPELAGLAVCLSDAAALDPPSFLDVPCFLGGIKWCGWSRRQESAAQISNSNQAAQRGQHKGLLPRCLLEEKAIVPRRAITISMQPACAQNDCFSVRAISPTSCGPRRAPLVELVAAIRQIPPGQFVSRFVFTTSVARFWLDRETASHLDSSMR